MKNIRVAAAELNQTPLDWQGNFHRINIAVEEARKRGVTILCLPELCLTGYNCADEFPSPELQERAITLLEKLAPLTQGMVVSVGLPLEIRNGLYNASAMLADGKIVGFVCKQHLANDGIHYEARWFKKWPTGKRLHIELNGKSYPVGDLFFNIGGVKIGYEICEDAWVGPRPGIALAAKGVDIILNPSASHFAFGKIETRRRFVIEGSRAFGCTYIYSNLLGNEAGRAIYDGGGMVASGGSLFAIGRRFAIQDVLITDAVVDVDATRLGQKKTASFEPYLVEEDGECVSAPYSFPEIAPEIPNPKMESWEVGKFIKEEEFAHAETLALWDFVRKSHQTGFVVSLSGGADSAACASLVYLMAHRVINELGIDELIKRLAFKNPPQGFDALMKRLLTTAYQATKNSGEITRRAARQVAEGVGSNHYELDVDTLVEGYTGMIEKALGRKLEWSTDDAALQNIQARVRSPGIWMLANLNNSLLLTTSNRSEAAVGYATMDGDTSGGLSPLAGIDKAFLRHWLEHVYNNGVFGQGHMALRIPELREVIVQAPTAELRPSENHQTDEDDLMPYPVLDAIEREAILNKRMPVSVFKNIRVAFPQYSVKQLGIWIDRFFKLWCRNQWKRERYAISFHLDDHNLDPKSGCRFPILNSGFETELNELREYISVLPETQVTPVVT